MQIYQELKTKNGVLRGYLHQASIKEKHPLVIMFHGFTGHKGENRFLFVQFSRYLCKHNISSLRFDFLGSGESDHDFNYMTFSNEVTDAVEILKYAKTLPFVSKIIVLGLSMGGAVATQLAKECYQDIDKLILWAPAGIMKELVNMREKDYLPRENGNYDIGGIELSQDFIIDINKYDLFKELEKFKNPVAIFHGLKDTSIPLSVSKKYCDIYPNCVLHTYEEGDHTFTNILVRKALFSDNLKFIVE